VDLVVQGNIVVGNSRIKSKSTVLCSCKKEPSVKGGAPLNGTRDCGSRAAR
jgi:hypothetical protein